MLCLIGKVPFLCRQPWGSCPVFGFYALPGPSDPCPKRPFLPCPFQGFKSSFSGLLLLGLPEGSFSVYCIISYNGCKQLHDGCSPQSQLLAYRAHCLLDNFTGTFRSQLPLIMATADLPVISPAWRSTVSYFLGCLSKDILLMSFSWLTCAMGLGADNYMGAMAS